MNLIIFIIGLGYTLVCFFLILVILLQSGKGGGLSGMLSGSNPLTDTLGSTGAEKTLSKWTTVCAVAFFIMALLLTFLGGALLKPTRLSDQLKSSAPPASSVAPPIVEDTEASPSSENAPPSVNSNLDEDVVKNPPLNSDSSTEQESALPESQPSSP